MSSKLVAAIDYWANRMFTSRYNPFYYLGQLSILLLIVLLVSGIYILLFYKINVERAYDAVEYITVEQWYLGGIMRSIHRYASDALVITLLLHGLRLLVTGKFRFNRWLVWVSGVALFGFILIEGITGYWMVWDERAQLVATTTAEFLDSVPIFPKPLARAFISEESVTNLLFFAVIFVHVGGPMFLTALILLHFSRFTRTLILPPRKIWAGVLLIMLALALVKPAVSAPPADLSKAAVSVPVDWFYMFLLPLMHSNLGLYSWLLLFAAGLATLATPWIKRATRPKTAEVIKEKCVGCELCYNDCPYGAITMITEGEKPLAEVSETRCASCGTCLGSCNFNAVQLDALDLEKMKSEITGLLSDQKKEPLLLGFVCEHALDVKKEVDEKGNMQGLQGVKILPLRCIGMVNPAIISHALDAGAAGVFLGGCKIGDCYYRLGNKWLKGRLEGKRAPVLKDKRLDRIRTYWVSPSEREEFLDAVRGFKEELKGKAHEESYVPREEKIRKKMLPLAALILLLPTLLIWYFSDSPSYSSINEDDALLLFTMSHKGERLEPCVEPTIEELKARNFTACKRERVPVIVEIDIDGAKVLSKSYDPKGIRKDGPSYAYEKIRVPPGSHRISIRVRDSRDERFDYGFDKVIEFNAGRIVIIDFEDKRFAL
jgi:quinol-cytochrome oxidoreductase complex cytochrome b subunit/coenzyme F420-reducing hydrogenase delta subunit